MIAVPILYAVTAALIVWFAIEGARQGVVRRLVEIVGLVVVFVFASRLAGDLEPILHDEWGMSARVAFFGAWLVVIVGGVVAVRLLSSLSQKIVRLTIAGWLDKGGGALLGAVFGAVLASCALIFVLALPLEDDVRREMRDDRWVGPVMGLAPAVYDVAREAWNGQSFFEMIEEHTGRDPRDAARELRGAVEDAVRGEKDDGRHD